MSRIALHVSLALVLASPSGCKHEPSKPTPAATVAAATSPPSPEAEAARIFKSRCTVCHGARGAGDGPAGVALHPKPRAFVDKAWQASVDDARLSRVIVEGGTAVKLSPAMASNPDLRSKPEVLAELVKLVRGFGK